MSPLTITVFKGSPSGHIIQTTTPLSPLTTSQVLVEIHYAGLCGTDLHYLHNDQVLGHEGVGVVKELGPSVRHLKIGDRVGFGWYHDSCGHCAECLVGDGGHCRNDPHAFGTHDLEQGGFATHVVWKEDFLYPIPAAMSLADAAPMMCAGITVFTPLTRYVKPGQRVGVVGIGALGHLAIQFACRMGAEVVAFSGTEGKRAEAIKLGATEFVVTKATGEAKPDGGLLDVLLVTTSALPDWNMYLRIMAPYGTIVPLMIQFDNLSIPFLPFLLKGIRFQGSSVGTRLEFRNMLEFAVRHGVKPTIERFPLNLEGIEEAKAMMEGGRLRYKAVLEVEHA